MAHAQRSRRWIVCVALSAVCVGGCEIIVGIPNVTLASDAGAEDSGSTACAHIEDGAVRLGPAMVRIDSTLGSYCIDTTEVTVSQFNAFVLATGGSLVGTPALCTQSDGGALPTPPVDSAPTHQNHPAGNLGECHAWAYCAWAGKRLCGMIGGGEAPGSGSDTEWGFACMNGVQNLPYPYGSTYDPAACNIGNPDGGAEDVASKTGCRGTTSPFDQIYDMVGNAWEFVNDLAHDNGQSVGVHGGAWDDTKSITSINGGCQLANGFNGLIFDFQESGFRCCADPVQ